MNYYISDLNQGKTSFTIDENEGITLIKISVLNETPNLVDLQIVWEEPCIDTYVQYGALEYNVKDLKKNFELSGRTSHISDGSPFQCLLNNDDTNAVAVAVSEGIYKTEVKSGIIEENANVQMYLTVRSDAPEKEYYTEIRIDRRHIPFYHVTEDVAAWWASHENYEPAYVPDVARETFYSTWYSFHQAVTHNELIEELKLAKEYGCKGVIIDDGWQTSDNNRGYDFTGDWELVPDKIPDMKKFADEVHDLGMKIMIWYSVPFVGKKSKAYSKFEGKLLCGGSPAVYDPRYPENRQFFIDVLKKALTEWDLDGFKLDFIDSFHNYPDEEKHSYAPGKDCPSVAKAVDIMFKDMFAQLRSIKPDILIEFRQNYIGPAMRTYGNIFRATDCANDAHVNRLHTTSLRLMSGNTAVHSDMIMWNMSETPEQAAIQLYDILFATPQISVKYNSLPESHKLMLKRFAALKEEFFNTIHFGKMTYKSYHSNFNYMSASDENFVGAVYSSEVAYIDSKFNKALIVNATQNKDIILKNSIGDFTADVEICDCMGNVTYKKESLPIGKLSEFSIPYNGSLRLSVC